MALPEGRIDGRHGGPVGDGTEALSKQRLVIPHKFANVEASGGDPWAPRLTLYDRSIASATQPRNEDIVYIERNGSDLEMSDTANRRSGKEAVTDSPATDSEDDNVATDGQRPLTESA